MAEAEADTNKVAIDRRADTAIKLTALLKAAGVGESWLVLTLFDVDAAMVEALDKHGAPTSDPMRGIVTCSEELGEAAAEALDATRGAGPMSVHHLNRMYQELCQLSAYSALLATSMRLQVKEIEYERSKQRP